MVSIQKMIGQERGKAAENVADPPELTAGRQGGGRGLEGRPAAGGKDGGCLVEKGIEFHV